MKVTHSKTVLYSLILCAKSSKRFSTPAEKLQKHRSVKTVNLLRCTYNKTKLR